MAGVILLGGGLDSTALLLHLHHVEQQNLTGIWFGYGQKADQLELKAVTYWCNKLGIELKVLYAPLHEIADSAILRGGNHGSNKLEGRNVVFTFLAATYAATIGCEELYIGIHREPHDAPFPDATMRAAEMMQCVLDVAYKKKLRLLTPFSRMTRTEILRRGYDIDQEILTHTHTCYENVEGGCGSCVHCRQRSTMIMNMLGEKDDPLPENS